MDSTFPTPHGRSIRWIIRLALMVGLCSFVMMTVISFAFAVSADSPIFSDSSTKAVTAPKSAVKTDPSRGVGSTVVEPLPLPAETPQPLPGFLPTFFRLILALGLTVGLIYLTVWGLKFLWEKKGFTAFQDEGKPIKVIATVYLAPRKTLHLVEVGKRILVLAAGNEEIHSLDVISDEEEVASLKKACHQGFPELFGKLLNRQEAREQTSEAKKIVSEGRQVVNDYISKVQNISKSMKKKPDEEEG